MVKRISYVVPEENKYLIENDDFVVKRVRANSIIVDYCKQDDEVFYRIWEVNKEKGEEVWNLVSIVWSLEAIRATFQTIFDDENYALHLFNVIQLKLIG